MDSDAIISAVSSVTKKWTKQRKVEERAASRASRREYTFREATETIKDVAYEVMSTAYLKASSNNTLPALARQIMYAARGPIQDRTGKPLDDKYFTQTLLPDYLSQYPDETADWDVVFDARGHFQEPHTNTNVPLGTIDVRDHLDEIATNNGDTEIHINLSDESQYPTKGPEHRYSAVLFIEKEGFLELFKRVRLKEKYDLAIMSTKGMSVTASRSLVDSLCGNHGIPLLVLHDFDKAGFSILGTLQRDNRRYEFEHSIKVIDLGLRLKDVQEYDLPSEDFSHRSDPSWNLRENGATKEEIEFLQDRRVELNAFTSGDFIAWIEAKLKEQRIEKVVPSIEVLRKAYQRAVAFEYVRNGIDILVDEAKEHAETVSIPRGLKTKVKEQLEKHPDRAWDTAIAGMVD